MNSAHDHHHVARRSRPGRLATLLLILALFLFRPPFVSATGPIVLDGQFGDWEGQAFISDPALDAQNEPTDLKSFSWANNPDDPTAYFMAER